MSLICRGLEVKIISEGECLPFYDVQDQFNKTTAYIASVAGQVFNTMTSCYVSQTYALFPLRPSNSLFLVVQMPALYAI